MNNDSIVQRRIVKTGIVSGYQLEIVSGLAESEIVVITGQEMLKDNLKVKVMKN
jgi:hypothetical protein